MVYQDARGRQHASILLLQLDARTGTARAVDAADVLGDAVRSADIVARLGGDEFAALSGETDLPEAHTERTRLRDLLAAAGVPASVGAATRDPQGGLGAAVGHADSDMYRAKDHRPHTDR